ncbi:MAG: MBL fold metallo-hydrolase [Rhodobacteraceae bacterium]|nr:MBL fold metallo-hydrolase [Paracoccaceae bacterium]
MKHIRIALWLLIATLASPLQAETSLTVHKVADNAFAIVGDLGQRNPQNMANNASFGLVVTNAGAVLIDAGGSRAGAVALHKAISTVTDQPVTHVINSGGQDHRWLGNGYWKEQGAVVIASAAAVEDQQERASMQLTVLSNLLGNDVLAGTEPVYADVTFEESYELAVGGTVLQLTHLDGAHTPGDAFVWNADSKTMFTGDIVYMERILGVNDVSNTLAWVETFEAFAAFNPDHVVPGHGHATDLAGATKDTYDYLTNLRTQMATFIEDGGEITDSIHLDQSAFSYLANFEGLAKRNAQATFGQMEWE